MVELLVTIVIVGILVAVAAPLFTQYVAGKKMRASVDYFADSIRLTRSEALRRNRVVTMCRSVDSISCANGSQNWADGWIIFLDNPPFGTRAPNETIVYAQEAMPAGGRIVPTGTGGFAVSFNPTGVPNRVGVGGAVNQTVAFQPYSPDAATSPLRRNICISFTGSLRVIPGNEACGS